MGSRVGNSKQQYKKHRVGSSFLLSMLIHLLRAFDLPRLAGKSMKFLEISKVNSLKSLGRDSTSPPLLYEFKMENIMRIEIQ